MNTKQQEGLLFLVNDAVELRNSPNPEKAPEKQEPREITAEMIPQGDDVESRRTRQGLILEFYKWWKSKHPEQKLRNVSLNEDMNIRHISLVETSGHASLTYQSTLAVLQLDAILTYATKIKTVKMNAVKANQSQFKEMIIMHYNCPGLGKVKLTVGVKTDKDSTKVQYCITVMDVDIPKSPSQRPAKKEKRTGGKPIR